MTSKTTQRSPNEMGSSLSDDAGVQSPSLTNPPQAEEGNTAGTVLSAGGRFGSWQMNAR
jgi:hypothetical protein